MHLGPREAVKVVENHGREGRAEFDEFGRRFVEFAAFVVGADDEDAHVAFAGGGYGGPVQVVDEIPVEIDVIEFAGGNGVENDIGGGVRGEADETDATIALELASRGEAAVFADGKIEEVAIVDAMQGEEVHVV